MTFGHGAPSAISADELATAVAAVAVAAAYLSAARRHGTSRRRWPPGRSASFLLGMALIVGAVVPPWPDDFRSHTAQHLLLGVYAPLGLVFGAPLTLALRAMPRRTARRLGRFVRRPALHALVHPAVAGLLHVGGLAVVMLTPVYELANRQPLVHGAVHLHYLLAGSLFAWAIAGPDPLGRRPGTAVRAAVLVMAAGAHAALAKFVYAHAAALATRAGDVVDGVQGGAELMYYGGDLAEVILAVALFAGWHRRRGELLRLRVDSDRPGSVWTMSPSTLSTARRGAG